MAESYHIDGKRLDFSNTSPFCHHLTRTANSSHSFVLMDALFLGYFLIWGAIQCPMLNSQMRSSEMQCDLNALTFDSPSNTYTPWSHYCSVPGITSTCCQFHFYTFFHGIRRYFFKIWGRFCNSSHSLSFTFFSVCFLFSFLSSSLPGLSFLLLGFPLVVCVYRKERRRGVGEYGHLGVRFMMGV